jgi:hypothetical protein
VLAIGILMALGAQPAHANAGSSFLNPDERLLGGNFGTQTLVDSSGRFTFAMQNDCNVVVYDGTRATWATDTYNFQGWYCFLAMQGDGNLVLYVNYQNTPCCWHPIWSSGTNGNYRSYLIVQSDGNVVIYQPVANPNDNPRVVWSTWYGRA